MEKTKQRISWIDVTKGIAIYLVILGHSLIGLKVNDYIFAFHMPLFFIASGLLFREKSIKKTITGNIKKLLVPYYITSVCVILGRAVSAYLQGWTVQNIQNLCLNTMIGAVFGYGVDGSKWFFTVWMIGAIWFLWAFFWSDIIIHVVFRYTKNWQEWQRAFLIIGISAVSYIVGQYIWIPTNLDVGGFAILFVYIGYLLQKIRIWEQGKLPWICWILCVIVYFFSSTDAKGKEQMGRKWSPEKGTLMERLVLVCQSAYMLSRGENISEQTLAVEAAALLKALQQRTKEEPDAYKRSMYIGIYPVGPRSKTLSGRQVEEPAHFSAMTPEEYIASEMVYPSGLLEKNVSGYALCEFTIDKEGVILRPHILRSTHPEFAEEALRIVKGMPKWSPALVGGKPADSNYTLYVPFRPQLYRNK